MSNANLGFFQPHSGNNFNIVITGHNNLVNLNVSSNTENKTSTSRKYTQVPPHPNSSNDNKPTIDKVTVTDAPFPTSKQIPKLINRPCSKLFRFPPDEISSHTIHPNSHPLSPTSTKGRLPEQSSQRLLSRIHDRSPTRSQDQISERLSVRSEDHSSYNFHVKTSTRANLVLPRLEIYFPPRPRQPSFVRMDVRIRGQRTSSDVGFDVERRYRQILKAKPDLKRVTMLQDGFIRCKFCGHAAPNAPDGIRALYRHLARVEFKHKRVSKVLPSYELKIYQERRSKQIN